MDMNSRVMGILTEKDINLNITNCNEVFKLYAGVKSTEEIIGRNDYDFPWHEYADIYRNHELDALSGKNYSLVIPFKIYTGDTLIFLHNKAQKTDQNNNVVGVVCHAVEIINPDMSNLMHVLEKSSADSRTQKQYSFGKPLTDIKLSPRQSELLFYLARGKTPKLIARITQLSVRTVETYLETLKRKLGCHTKCELIEFAINNGFINAIPYGRPVKELIEKLKSV